MAVGPHLSCRILGMCYCFSEQLFYLHFKLSSILKYEKLVIVHHRPLGTSFPVVNTLLQIILHICTPMDGCNERPPGLLGAAGSVAVSQQLEAWLRKKHNELQKQETFFKMMGKFQNGRVSFLSLVSVVLYTFCTIGKDETQCKQERLNKFPLLSVFVWVLCMSNSVQFFWGLLVSTA